jgi:hypothetical protein
MNRKTAFALIILLSSTIANSASSNLFARVLYVGTYGDGTFFVGLDTTIDEPGCPQPRIQIPPNHPELKNWLAIATTAYAADLSVQFRTTGCYGAYPTIDQSSAGWFHLKPR